MLGLAELLLELARNGETLDLEDNADTSFGRKRLCVKTKHAVSTLETFKVIIKRKVFMVRAKELFSWNPTILVHKEKEYTSKDESINNKFYPHPNKKEPGNDYASDEDGIPEIVFGSSSSSHKQDNGDKDVTHLEDPFRLYDLLKNKKGDDNHKPSPSLSHPLGFTPDASEKRDENINDTAFQETKMTRVSDMDVKFLCGNSNYDYVCSDSLGSSGGSVRFKNKMISELGEINKVMDRGEFDDATVFHRFELKRKLLNVIE
nr:RNA-directed DNA polymerase, eukaryota [Tanacetum cinerariifolium]